MVLEWLRHQLSDAVFGGLARSALFFGELEAILNGVTAYQLWSPFEYPPMADTIWAKRSESRVVFLCVLLMCYQIP